VSKVPAVTVIPPGVVNAPPSVHPPPTPLKVNPVLIDTPFVVTVFPVVVAVKVVLPAFEKVVPECKVNDPAMFNPPPVPAIVTPDTLIDKSKQFILFATPELTVNGAPLFASKMTLSVAVGADAPLAPPDVVAQFVVAAVLH
jgi:hypothetical protein